MRGVRACPWPFLRVKERCANVSLERFDRFWILEHGPAEALAPAPANVRVGEYLGQVTPGAVLANDVGAEPSFSEGTPAEEQVWVSAQRALQVDHPHHLKVYRITIYKDPGGPGNLTPLTAGPEAAGTAEEWGYAPIASRPRSGDNRVMGTLDPDVAITILFCIEVALVAIGGGYIIRYELRRSHADRQSERRP